MIKEKQPLITIAIPTYNRGGSFLRDALSCALNQSYKNIEILVADNCSPDNTEEIMRGISDPRLRYIRHKKNIGANNNFNYCINEARGDYLLLLLDDDLIDDDFIVTCLEAVNYETHYGIIRTGTRIINKQGDIIVERENSAQGLSTKELYLAWFDNRITMYVCSTLFNTKNLREVGGFLSGHNLFQDVIAETKIITKFERFDIKSVKASFRLHDTNMGGSAEVVAWCEDSLELLSCILYAVGEDDAVFKMRAKSFLCRMNYTHAAKIDSHIKRIYTYMKVAWMFDYSHSVLQFIYKNDIRPFLRNTKKRFRSVLPSSTYL